MHWLLFSTINIKFIYDESTQMIKHKLTNPQNNLPSQKLVKNNKFRKGLIFEY